MAEDERNSTSIDDLPEECLMIIADQLSSKYDRDSFSSTCQRWLRIESSLRRTLHLSHRYYHEKGYGHMLECLLDRFQAVNIISFTGCEKLSDSALPVLKSKCPQLKKLYLDRCLNITDDGLGSIGFSSLELLSLYRCNVSDSGLENISRACPSLKGVNLSYCSKITDTGISALGRGCLAIKYISISNCNEIRGVGFSSFSSLIRLDADTCKLSDEGLSLTTQGCESLRYLDLSHPRNCSYQLGPHGYASIGTFCKNLQVLNLKLCRVLDDAAVIEIARGCRALKELNLAVCTGIKEAGWRAVADHCTNLEILHVNRCRSLTNEGLGFVRNGCPRLRRLYLNVCPMVSRTAIEIFKMHRWQVTIVTLEFMGESLGLYESSDFLGV
ncbi:hypothetical protein R1flu_013577 [Riccia fluitans]|uniref:F-box/LRR-repeat protein 15-like leucin rich repeat domain-containing protein n=1 Tax=Riccia fluitans TaxID=41844 RepID=A0ABD1YDQ8_9MARC